MPSATCGDGTAVPSENHVCRRPKATGLKTGRRLPDNLQGIIDASAGTTAPQLYPYVQLNDSLFADVHVLNRGEEKQLILQDVSEGHDDEYKLQQKAHEVSLLLEQQAELNRAQKRLPGYHPEREH